MKIIFALIFLLFASESWAQPFLVSDPSAGAIGGQFIVWETKTVKRKTATTVYYTDDNMEDGSVWMDLKNVAVGTHLWGVQYYVEGAYSGAAQCVLRVTRSCITVKRKKTCTKNYQLNP